MNDDEHRMLEFEGQWWRTPGGKAAAIREEFGMSETRYYQRLNDLISRNEAVEAYPVLVKRLRRIRARRSRGRKRRG